MNSPLFPSAGFPPVRLSVILESGPSLRIRAVGFTTPGNTHPLVSGPGTLSAFYRFIPLLLTPSSLLFPFPLQRVGPSFNFRLHLPVYFRFLSGPLSSRAMSPFSPLSAV